MKRRHILAVSALLTCQAPQAQSRDVYSMIIPMGGGSGGDTGSRIIAEAASKILNKTVIVENKPGGDTMIATSHVINGPADGSRILLTTPSTWLILPMLGTYPKYKPEIQLEPVITYARGAAALVCKTGRFADLHAMIAAAKKDPGKVSIATYGGHYYKLLAWMIQHELGVVFNHVSYKDPSTATNDVLGGNVDLLIRDAGGAREFVLAGKNQVLALTNEKNPGTFKDARTFSELGFPSLSIYVWTGYAIKSGAPKELTERLYQAFSGALRSKEYMAYT